jgi:hypothetical protein
MTSEWHREIFCNLCFFKFINIWTRRWLLHSSLFIYLARGASKYFSLPEQTSRSFTMQSVDPRSHDCVCMDRDCIYAEFTAPGDSQSWFQHSEIASRRFQLCCVLLIKFSVSRSKNLQKLVSILITQLRNFFFNRELQISKSVVFFPYSVKKWTFF